MEKVGFILLILILTTVYIYLYVYVWLNLTNFEKKLFTFIIFLSAQI